jgi:hypothetical protein
LCKCVGCKNCDESTRTLLQLANAADLRKQQQQFQQSQQNHHLLNQTNNSSNNNNYSHLQSGGKLHPSGSNAYPMQFSIDRIGHPQLSSLNGLKNFQKSSEFMNNFEFISEKDYQKQLNL